MMQEKPHLLAIQYRGSLWRWRACGTCREQFWKNTTIKTLMTPIQKLVYCSKACQTQDAIDGNR